MNNLELEEEIKKLCELIIMEQNNKQKLEKLHNILGQHPSAARMAWECDSIPVFLLQETIAPYSILHTEKIDELTSEKIKIVLNILEIMVKDHYIKKVFVDARFPYYTYKYLVISNTDTIYENIRTAALGVIYSLMNDSDAYIHNQLKATELVPLLLKIIDLGSETSKMLSVNIFSLIISSEEGLNYACQTFDRFSAINLMFNSLVIQAVEFKSLKLTKAVIQIYIRMCSKNHIKMSLCSKRPEGLFTPEAKALINSDKSCEELYKKFVDLIC